MRRERDRSVVWVAHRCNRPGRVRLALRMPWIDGIECDVHLHPDGPQVRHAATDAGVPLAAVLDAVAEAARRQGRRVPLLVELKGRVRDVAGTDGLVARLRAMEDRMEVRLAAFEAATLDPFLDAGWPCHVFVQGEARPGRLTWSGLGRSRIDPRVGLHVRLHRFGRAERPTLDEVEATGRPFMMSGWHRGMRGWPARRLGGVWNVRGPL